MSANNENGTDGHTWVQTIAAIIGVIVAVAAFFGISGIRDFSRPTPTDTPIPPITTQSLNTNTPIEPITTPTVATPTPSVEPLTSTPLLPTDTPAPTETPMPQLNDTWIRPADGMTMVYVPAGSFLMGSVAGDPEADDDEFPRHEVTLDGFWLDQTEVTNAQFVAFLNAEGNQTQEGVTWLNFDTNAQIMTEGNPFSVETGFENHPIIYVTWYGANAYCAWVGGQLPSEAQWEYAARGSENLRYPWGNEAPDNTRLNYNSNENGTVAVGSYPNEASWVGALDMAGNVWEWTNDWYDSDYYAESPSENPSGPTEGDRGVLRGGGWFNAASNVRAAFRSNDSPAGSNYFIGFRCVALPSIR